MPMRATNDFPLSLLDGNTRNAPSDELGGPRNDTVYLSATVYGVPLADASLG